LTKHRPKHVEERAERAEKRVESLEKFIRNELFPRVAGPVSAPAPASRPASPPSPPPSLVRGPLPGIGLDLSRVQDREIKEGNAGVVRQRANEALKERGITCLGVNSKGKGRYRLLFKEADVDGLRRDNSWVRTHFDKGVLYGEQWYPIRIDKAYREVATDELGCTIFGRMNGVKVHKMRWLGTASVDKEYRTMVVYLDRKEEVDRFLAKITVQMASVHSPSHLSRGCNQQGATVATFTDIYTIVARRRLLSVDSVLCLGTQPQLAPQRLSSVQRVVGRGLTRLQTLVALCIDES
jgi:hypothetical protein